MTGIAPARPATAVTHAMLARNDAGDAFFSAHGDHLAALASRMADRFAAGGRLLAFGRQQYATDAQHIEVEFVHPVIVGKRALPAMDVSGVSPQALHAVVQPEDILVWFGSPSTIPPSPPSSAEGRGPAQALIDAARARGALTVAFPGPHADHAFDPASGDPFIHQELVEIACHTLWESVHVFLEHRGTDQHAGAAAFLYPFLDGPRPDPAALIGEVAGSIRSKAAESGRLRLRVASDQGDAILAAASAMHERVRLGGRVLALGNGGSATDANDLVLDCLASPKGHAFIPAASLASSAATLSALANDLGAELTFLRQLIALGRAGDVGVAISTSGNSPNIIAALEEARRRGLVSIALIGGDGGAIARRGLADHAVIVPCDYVPRAQEVHASVYHIVLDAVHALRAGGSADRSRE